jgi:hypothetical protein
VFDLLEVARIELKLRKVARRIILGPSGEIRANLASRPDQAIYTQLRETPEMAQCAATQQTCHPGNSQHTDPSIVASASEPLVPRQVDHKDRRPPGSRHSGVLPGC